eukprot:m.451286 g.451286  ORF g.451286 m.451286 type:complete len:263 (+) comp21524_c0_seq4:555-1343(+)
MSEKTRDNLPVIGILTGISYVSGLDYYKGINEIFGRIVGKRHLIPANPLMLLASVDCDIYAKMLTDKEWTGVAAHLLQGVEKLVSGGMDVLCIASNTGHIAFPAISQKYPDLEILHIADCTAKQIKSLGLSTVGLIGTEPTMREAYLKDRLRQHGISVVIPQEEEMSKIFNFIMNELGFNDFKDDTRAYFVDQIRALQSYGAQGVILGCTEIELLVDQSHVPEVPLFPSAKMHIDAAARIAAGTQDVTDYLPHPIPALTKSA